MSSNTQLTKAARAYAEKHGVAYAEARRRVLAAHQALLAEITAGQMRVATIQQVTRSDGRQPYPFHIDAFGFVGNQGFFKGDPLYLIGFTDHPDEFDVSLTREDFLATPELAVGKHPVLMARTKDWATYPGEVEKVTVSSRPTAGRGQVSARVFTPDALRGDGTPLLDTLVGVGHLMEYLHEADLRALRSHNWCHPEVGRVLLWLLSIADGGQDADLMARLDDLDEEAVAVTVALDAQQAEQWLANTHPRFAETTP